MTIKTANPKEGIFDTALEPEISEEEKNTVRMIKALGENASPGVVSGFGMLAAPMGAGAFPANVVQALATQAAMPELFAQTPPGDPALPLMGPFGLINKPKSR